MSQYTSTLTLLHSERLKLYAILAFLSAIGSEVVRFSDNSSLGLGLVIKLSDIIVCGVQIGLEAIVLLSIVTHV